MMIRPRLAIITTGPVDRDPRVLREAKALANAGHEVRCFWPVAPDHDELAVVLGSNITGAPVPVVQQTSRALLAVLRRLGIEAPIMQATAPARASAPLIEAPTWLRRVGKTMDTARRLRRSPASDVGAPEDISHAHRVLRWQVSAIAALATRAAEYDPVSVLAIDAPSLPAAAALKVSCDARLLYDAHEIYHAQSPWGQRHSDWVEAWTLIEKSFAPLVDHGFGVSRGIVDYLRNEVGVSHAELLLNIPEGPIPNAALEKTQPNTPFRIQFHGHLLPDRGLEIFIEAACYLDDSVRLVLRGDGSHRDALRDLAARVGVDSRVLFEPAVSYERLLPVLAHEDAGVLLYPDHCRNHRVSLPNKFFEGLYAGLPQIVPASSEAAHYVDELGCGVTYERLEPKTLADVFLRLAPDATAWQRYHTNAVAAAQKDFVWESEVAHLTQAAATIRAV